MHAGEEQKATFVHSLGTTKSEVLVRNRGILNPGKSASAEGAAQHSPGRGREASGALGWDRRIRKPCKGDTGFCCNGIGKTGEKPVPPLQGA